MPTVILQPAKIRQTMSMQRRVNLDVQTYVAKVTQGFGTIFFRILYSILFKIEIFGKENIANEKGPMIIVSNHVVFFDSFIFHLFFAPNASLLPLRFMAVTKFQVPFLNFLSKIRVIHFIYLLFGVFVVKQGEGLEKNLQNAVDILKRGGTVTIFPAGHMRGDNSLGEFKRGAAALAQLTDSPVIPVAIKRVREKGKRTRFTLLVGKKFKMDKHQSFEQGTAFIRSKIEELHNQIS